MSKHLKSWPDWPLSMQPGWLLLTPAKADGWSTNLWRVQRSGADSISCGQMVAIKGEAQFEPVSGYACIIARREQIAAIYTKTPRGDEVEEFVTWDRFVEQQRAARRQQQIAMARAQSGGLVVPGPPA